MTWTKPSPAEEFEMSVFNVTYCGPDCDCGDLDEDYLRQYDHLTCPKMVAYIVDGVSIHTDAMHRIKEKDNGSRQADTYACTKCKCGFVPSVMRLYFLHLEMDHRGDGHKRAPTGNRIVLADEERQRLHCGRDSDLRAKLVELLSAAEEKVGDPWGCGPCEFKSRDREAMMDHVRKVHFRVELVQRTVERKKPWWNVCSII